MQQDRSSNSLPGSSAGPNKAGASAPSGAAALGSEIGAERDARRELAQAQREGDSIPTSTTTSSNAADLGFGQLNGAEQGISTPGAEKRDQLQNQRNTEFNKDQPDLRKLAASSAGSAAHNPLGGEAKSSGAQQPDDILETVSRSTGTESGTGAVGTGEIEVGRDASTARTA
ncbi:potential RNA Pol II transcription elongation factor [Pseudozyma hubeiensis SY62]|uniref:Potential RNA Pol II transcription elongation factor n=1 Tax=Pseudozyma hubeiensis (strain SY62) TaxID=1305764 RepID=R9NVI7_PSEHS|nr:potential RNA Pol II transcription elongation factor [Pseudozyma hubeiensis SY62]GAC92453.1 potential RNA Pol II transcription elongation factor [Pseudozyma hubeiensis SY62]